MAGVVSPVSTENLNRLLSAVNEFDASDLHLVASVPPAFRVNGEIIIADEDALTEAEITVMANSLMNEYQRKKYEQEWELCISILHSVAGRVRATFYRRNNNPELSFRFCGDKIATREELGLPEKIDDLARKPNGLLLITAQLGQAKRRRSIILLISSILNAAARLSRSKIRLNLSITTNAPSWCSRRC
jgi:twitching motility protein PilT